MKPLKWGLDVDGVTCDWLAGSIKLAEAMTGRVMPPVKSWKWDHEMLTPEEFEAFWEYQNSHMNWWENLPALPGTREALSDLHRASRFKKHDIYFITNRHSRRGMKLTTERWLDTQGYPGATVILAGKGAKPEVINALGLDLFVDDKPQNCFDIAARCPKTEVFLVTDPSVAATKPYLDGLDLEGTRVQQITSLASLVKRVLV